MPCDLLLTRLGAPNPGYVELIHGGEGASIDPREVVMRVVATRAREAPTAQNHPTGSAKPSLADHLIVGKTIASLKDRGLLS